MAAAADTKYTVGLTVAAIIVVGIATATHFFKEKSMDRKFAFRTTEPLLISAPNDETNRHLLPIGTVIYHQQSFDEGHSTYLIELNYKGTPPAERIDSMAGAESALWAFPIQKTDLQKLISDYPLTREELATLLKARKVSRDELAQIVREWKD